MNVISRHNVADLVVSGSLPAAPGAASDINKRPSKLRSAKPPAGSPSQLPLFPSTELYALPSLPKSTILLPRSILQIKTGERLCDYLSRVADAAMSSATKVHGTPRQAAIRLGTTDQESWEEPKANLVLAVSNR